MLGEQLGRRLREVLDLGAVRRLDERVTRGEVAVQGADAHAGTLGDGLERDVGAALREGVAGRREKLVAVALGVGAKRLVRCDRHVKTEAASG